MLVAAFPDTSQIKKPTQQQASSSGLFAYLFYYEIPASNIFKYEIYASLQSSVVMDSMIDDSGTGSAMQGAAHRSSRAVYLWLSFCSNSVLFLVSEVRTAHSLTHQWWLLSLILKFVTFANLIKNMLILDFDLDIFLVYLIKFQLQIQ